MGIIISEDKRKMYIGNDIILTIEGYNYYARIIQKWWKKIYILKKKLIPCKRKYDIMNENDDKNIKENKLTFSDSEDNEYDYKNKDNSEDNNENEVEIINNYNDNCIIKKLGKMFIF